MTVLFGLNLYDDVPSALSRQRRTAEALAALPGVEAINLQFHDARPSSFLAIPTLPALRLDSNAVTGARGRRKPIVRELFDVTASVARERGHTYFACVNNDIVVTRAALDLVKRGGRQTYVFSRGDVDELGETVWDGDSSGLVSRRVSMMTAGQDMFVVSAAWWAQNASRFRPYVIGEGCWDNVYTSTMMCHSDGLLLNRHPDILHERHAALWHDDTPAARYNGMLAALDARYFSLWCEYWQALEEHRRRDATAEEEQRLRETILTWRRSASAAALQFAKSARARLRYWQLRRSWPRPASA